MRPVKVLGGITLNNSVGGLNPDAVMKCLGFPGFKYVWMPMADSYYHQLVVFNKKNSGIKYVTDNKKIVPELKEILHIIADNDLILASGHYAYKETAILMEEAKKIGVKRMEVIHPTLIVSKHTIAEMRELANEGVKIGLMAVTAGTVRFLEGIRWLFRVVKELSDHMIWGSDSGQIQNPTHIEMQRWTIRVLLANGITKEEITNIFKINPAKHLGID
jgi:imidazolonepropionase-like amidohydrolase